MKRSGFKRPQFDRPPRVAYTLARACVQVQIEDTARPAHKAPPVRSEAYRRLVAALPCIRCGIVGYSNHAHGNTGKGMGMKTDDRFAFPLCVDRPGVAGCHRLFDQHALYTREQRRLVEVEWSQATQDAIVQAGKWPAGLPPYNQQA